MPNATPLTQRHTNTLPPLLIPFSVFKKEWMRRGNMEESCESECFKWYSDATLFRTFPLSFHIQIQDARGLHLSPICCSPTASVDLTEHFVNFNTVKPKVFLKVYIEFPGYGLTYSEQKIMKEKKRSNCTITVYTVIYIPFK